MPITQDKVIRLLEITKFGLVEVCDSLIAELQPAPELEDVDDTNVLIATADAEPTDADGALDIDIPWSFEGIELPTGGWQQVGEPVDGVTHRWPDGNVDAYNSFVTYTGTEGKSGVALALGYKNHETIGFVLSPSGGSKRGLTVFFEADDFQTSNEKLSMIKGGGPRGRSGFADLDPLPGAYAGFNIELLGNRVAGKWNRQAVVAKADDHETMLDHTFLQAKLRYLA